MQSICAYSIYVNVICILSIVNVYNVQILNTRLYLFFVGGGPRPSIYHERTFHFSRVPAGCSRRRRRLKNKRSFEIGLPLFAFTFPIPLDKNRQLHNSDAYSSLRKSVLGNRLYYNIIVLQQAAVRDYIHIYYMHCTDYMHGRHIFLVISMELTYENSRGQHIFTYFSTYT